MVPLILFFTILLGCWYWKQHRLNPTEPPVYPGALPLLGHCHLLIGNQLRLWKTVKKLVDTSYTMGGVLSTFIGPKIVYVVTDPEDCFTVANTCLEKDYIYDFAEQWLGDGLVTSKLSKWKKHRKLLLPAFSQVVLDSFIDVLNRQSRRLVDDLKMEVGKRPFDPREYTKINALETICSTMLNIDYNDHSLLNSDYIKATEEIFTILEQRFRRLWLQTDFLFQFSNLKKQLDGCLKIVHNMSNMVLQRRKLEMYGNITNNDNQRKSSTKSKLFLDLLVELSVEKGAFTDRQMREHLDTMIIAGHDTSANVLMYVMILLGSFPDVQEKAYAEVTEVLGDSNRDIEKKDLTQLIYLEAILKESMRVYTVTPVSVRKLDQNVKLKNCTLKAGRSCALFLSGVNCHPVWGPDADQFKPERWLEPTTLPDISKAFAGFSVGRRMCIGKTYALMSMKITLAHLLRSYRFKADHSKLIFLFNVIMQPKSGHLVTIERR